MEPSVDFLSHDSVAPTRVGDLLDLCFGPARHKRTAALLRDGAPRIEPASFVALDCDALVGSVEVWQIDWRHPRGDCPIAMLGPLVAHPERRGERIGARLLDLALGEVDKLGLPVMLIGDAPYYGRWGFSAKHTANWRLSAAVDRARLLLRADCPHRFAGPALLGSPGSACAAA
jgi:predicted N-acetyltransferase YhbS